MMEKDLGKYSSEIKAIFCDLYQNSRGASESVLVGIPDIFMPLFIKYAASHSEDGVEDLYLKAFFEENIVSFETKSKLMDGLKEIEPIKVANLKMDPPGLLLDPNLSRILLQAREEVSLLPIKENPSCIYPSHVFLAALKVNPPIKTLFEKEGISYYHLVKIFKNHSEIFDKLTSMMNNTFEKMKKDKDSNPTESYYHREGSTPWGGDFNPERWMESMGFPSDDDDDDDFPTPWKSPGSSKTPMLDRFAKKIGEEMEPLVGRSEELGQLLEILGCKKKNNAILIGEAGVGKTAVVELLAQKIKLGEVPDFFKNKKIYSLDLNSLVAGTKYRGQYEERLKGLIEEVTGNKDIIVYIDEIHNLIGNGGSDGSGDAANVLKPYLARGTFQCIGSTTFKEYRKFFEKDSALKRRFQNVIINEPSKQEVLSILKHIKKSYESHHGVVYNNKVLEACISLSERYMTDRNFPDKAVDALDLSGSLAKLEEIPEISTELEEVNKSLSEIDEELMRAVEEEQWAYAKEIQEKQASLELTKTSLCEKRDQHKSKVTVEHVKQAIGKRAGIPLDKIGTTDLDRLRLLNKILKKQVIGQEEAIREVVMSLQRNSLGLRDPKRPIASLLFVGPTGSGKTHLCKTLAREFFGSENALIRYDMNEYGEKHEVTKLTGAAASYVGYDDEPGFEQVRKNPYTVVLFDEIEKAAPEIFQIFLSILDEGQITLGNGVKANFKNTIIVFTGNIGTRDLSAGIGYDASQEISEDRKNSIIQKAIKKTFAPEFINRLTKTVIFHNLTREDMVKICDLELKQLLQRFKSQGLKVEVDSSVKDLIIKKCDLKYGARDLQRNVVKYVEEEVCQYLLDTSGDVTEGVLQILSDGSTVTVKKKN